MTFDARKFVVLAVLILLFMPVVKAADTTKKLPPRADSMSVWQARRVAGSRYRISRMAQGQDRPQQFSIYSRQHRVRRAHVQSGTEHFKVDLQTLEPVAVKCNSYGKQVVACFLKDEEGKSRPSTLDLVWREGSVWSAKCSDDCVYAAESFAAALNRLRTFAKDMSSPPHIHTAGRSLAGASTSPPPRGTSYRAFDGGGRTSRKNSRKKH